MKFKKMLNKNNYYTQKIWKTTKAYTKIEFLERLKTTPIWEVTCCQKSDLHFEEWKSSFNPRGGEGWIGFIKIILTKPTMLL